MKSILAALLASAVLTGVSAPALAKSSNVIINVEHPRSHHLVVSVNQKIWIVASEKFPDAVTVSLSSKKVLASEGTFSFSAKAPAPTPSIAVVPTKDRYQRTFFEMKPRGLAKNLTVVTDEYYRAVKPGHVKIEVGLSLPGAMMMGDENDRHSPSKDTEIFDVTVVK